MSRVVRTGIYTIGLIVIGTKIAGRRLGFDFCNFPRRIRGVLGRHLEGVHVDISVGTIVGAQAAADAPVLDGNLQAVAAADGPYRASDHA